MYIKGNMNRYTFIYMYREDVETMPKVLEQQVLLALICIAIKFLINTLIQMFMHTCI